MAEDKIAFERAALKVAIFDDGSRALAGALAPDANFGISRDEGALMLAFSHLAQRAIEDVYADCGDTDAGVLSSNVGQYIARKVHDVLFGEPDGVLRHPAADRATVAPNRETIARAIHNGPNAQAQYAKVGIGPHRWAECPYQAQYLADADAVLAVLVPADQVRAETLESARLALRGEFEPLTTRTPHWRNVDRVFAHAAGELRKTAGA